MVNNYPLVLLEVSYSCVIVWAAPQAIEKTKMHCAIMSKPLCPKISVNLEKRMRNPGRKIKDWG